MNKLTRNIVAFLVTFLTVQVCAMYILGGFDLQTVQTKLMSCLVGVGLSTTVLMIVNGPE
jgi:hypothetical protein